MLQGRKLRTRPRTGVCEPLVPDFVAPEVHQSNRSYVNSADLLAFGFTTREFSLVGGYTENYKTVKIGWWALQTQHSSQLKQGMKICDEY